MEGVEQLPARKVKSAAWQPMFDGVIPSLNTADDADVVAFETMFGVKVKSRVVRGGADVFKDSVLRKKTTQGNYRRDFCRYVVRTAAAATGSSHSLARSDVQHPHIICASARKSRALAAGLVQIEGVPLP